MRKPSRTRLPFYLIYAFALYASFSVLFLDYPARSGGSVSTRPVNHTMQTFPRVFEQRDILVDDLNSNLEQEAVLISAKQAFNIEDTAIARAVQRYRNTSFLQTVTGLIYPSPTKSQDLAVLVLTCNRQTSLEALLDTLSYAQGIHDRTVYVSIDCNPGPMLNATLWSTRGLNLQIVDSHQRHVVENGAARERRDERVTRHWLHAVSTALRKHENVLYLEDDHLVHPAILQDAAVLISERPKMCPSCFAVQLGCHRDCWGMASAATTASDVARMEPGNMGIVYSRGTWQWFLQHIDEYCSIYGIWDVNLHHLLSVHTKHQHALTFLKARVVHNSACGSDRNTGGRAQCDETVLQRDRERLVALDMSMNMTLSDHGTAEIPAMTILNSRAIQADSDTSRRCIDSTRQNIPTPPARKIISCFPYNGETKMLVDRVQSMSISFFVVSESSFAMNGSPKEMRWQRDFDALHNNTVRVKYLEVNENYYEATSNEGRWKQEVAVRKFLGVGVKELYDAELIDDEDIVVVTDADEIVNDDTLEYIRKHLKHGEYARVSLGWFLYNKCWMHHERTVQPAAVTVKTLRQSLAWNTHFVRAIQNDRVVQNSLRRMEIPILDNGYHCSWCFGKAEFRQKVATSLEIPIDLQTQNFDDSRIEEMWINGLNLQGGIHGKKICSAAEFERELSVSGIDRNS